MDDMEAVQELEVVCAQCGFPVVAVLDDAGRVVDYQELEAPKTEDEAVAAGWLDHGQGLYCPKCSEAQLELEAEASHQNSDVQEMIDREALKALTPDVDSETIEGFVRVFHQDRLSKLRMRAGYPPLPPYEFHPKDAAQAKKVLAALDEMRKKRDGHE